MKKSTKRRIRKVTKFILGATSCASILTVIILAGKNDQSVFSSGEAFVISLVSIVIFGGSVYLFDKLFGGDYYAE